MITKMIDRDEREINGVRFQDTINITPNGSSIVSVFDQGVEKSIVSSFLGAAQDTLDEIGINYARSNPGRMFLAAEVKYGNVPVGIVAVLTTDCEDVLVRGQAVSRLVFERDITITAPYEAEPYKQELYQQYGSPEILFDGSY